MEQVFMTEAEERHDFFRRKQEMQKSIAIRPIESAIPLMAYYLMVNSNCSDNYHTFSSLEAKMYYAGIREARFYTPSTNHATLLKEAITTFLAEKTAKSSLYYELCKKLFVPPIIHPQEHQEEDEQDS